MEVEEQVVKEVVDVVDEEEEKVYIGILILFVIMNCKVQASMEILLKFIHRIVLNNNSGPIKLRIYAMDRLRCEKSIKLTNFNIQTITMATQAKMEVIMELAIN